MPQKEQIVFKVYTTSGSLDCSISIPVFGDVEKAAKAAKKVEWFMKQLEPFLEILAELESFLEILAEEDPQASEKKEEENGRENKTCNR